MTSSVIQPTLARPTVTPPTLRPYQVQAIEKLRAKIRAGVKRVVCVMPTGGGKTILAAAMIQSAIQRGSRCLFFAHRRELVDQTVDKLNSFGVECGVIMGLDRRRDDFLPVQVASVQTLARRLDRLPRANIIFVDECHHASSETYQKVLDAYPDSIVIGLTATPWRSDKIGLQDIYEDSVLACTPAELMVIGALVRYDAYAYNSPDLHKIKVVAGDFSQRDLGVACNTKVLVGSVVHEYVNHAAGRRAIVFPVNIEHSTSLVNEFQAAGFTAEHVDYKTPTAARKIMMERFRTGDLTILASCGVLCEGFDAPVAEVCVLARPTKSMTLHLQMIGRILRPSPTTGKQRALIHDHAGNVLRHGFVEEERDYSLTATPDRVRALHTCPSCYKIFGATKQGKCPHCNVLITTPDERGEGNGRTDHVFVDGERISRAQIEKIRNKRTQLNLGFELSDEQIAKAARATRQEKAAEFLRLQNVAKNKNFKPGFVAHQYRQAFSTWPHFSEDDLRDVTPAETTFFPLRGKK